MHNTEAITVGIKTFLRTRQLEQCLESLTRHQWFQVIIADDGEIDQERVEMYQNFEQRMPLRLLRLDFDTGLAGGRNEIVKNCDTEYILMLDDDQTVPNNIGDLKDVLDEDSSLGGVSCIWVEHGYKKCTACNIKLKGEDVIKEYTRRDHKNNSTLFTFNSMPYKKFDFIPNSTLFKKACLDYISWDSFYKIGKEHLDFYLSHKLANEWKFAVALNVYIGHYPGMEESSNYSKYRKGERIKVSNDYLLKKFQISRVLDGMKYIEPIKSIKDYWLIFKRQFELTLKYGFFR